MDTFPHSGNRCGKWKVARVEQALLRRNPHRKELGSYCRPLHHQGVSSKMSKGLVKRHMIKITYYFRRAPNMRVVLGATEMRDKSNPEFRVKKVIKGAFNS